MLAWPPQAVLTCFGLLNHSCLNLQPLWPPPQQMDLPGSVLVRFGFNSTHTILQASFTLGKMEEGVERVVGGSGSHPKVVANPVSLGVKLLGPRKTEVVSLRLLSPLGYRKWTFTL